MTDWAGWGTSIGTLVLAGATFQAVRSSNRSARVAERTLAAGLRPVLIPSRGDDPDQSVQFAEGETFQVAGGRALAVAENGVVYLAIPLRNVGAGIADLYGYRIEADSAEEASRDPRGAAGHRRGDKAPDPGSFAEQQRDLYVAAGEIGFWQAARRDPNEQLHARLLSALGGGRITVDLLYADHEGGQRTITRFVMLPDGDSADRWRCNVTRHWSAEQARR